MNQKKKGEKWFAIKKYQERSLVPEDFCRDIVSYPSLYHHNANG